MAQCMMEVSGGGSLLRHNPEGGCVVYHSVRLGYSCKQSQRLCQLIHCTDLHMAKYSSFLGQLLLQQKCQFEVCNNFCQNATSMHVFLYRPVSCLCHTSSLALLRELCFSWRSQQACQYFFPLTSALSEKNHMVLF